MAEAKRLEAKVEIGDESALYELSRPVPINPRDTDDERPETRYVIVSAVRNVQFGLNKGEPETAVFPATGPESTRPSTFLDLTTVRGTTDHSLALRVLGFELK